MISKYRTGESRRDNLCPGLAIAVGISEGELSRVVQRVSHFERSQSRVFPELVELGMLAELHGSKVERTEGRFDEIKSGISRRCPSPFCRFLRHADRLRLLMSIGQ
jgi:hypothetical protein